MHELSIALSILDIAAEESKRREGAAIHAIHIQLGALSGVVTEALISAYELACEGWSFPDCRLVIEEVPVVIYCVSCDLEQPVETIQRIQCPRCGTPSEEIVRGREMDITAMEIAD